MSFDASPLIFSECPLHAFQVKGRLETVASATGIVNLTRRYADEYAGDSEPEQESMDKT